MKVSITRAPYGEYQFYLYEEVGEGRIRAVKKVDLITQEIGDNEAVEPTFYLSSQQADGFFQSMAKYLDDYGIKPGREFEVVGELKATKIHLEDMRKLVFNEEVNSK